MVAYLERLCGRPVAQLDKINALAAATAPPPSSSSTGASGPTGGSGGGEDKENTTNGGGHKKSTSRWREQAPWTALTDDPIIWSVLAFFAGKIISYNKWN
jgi:hypothetical protein